MKLYGNVIIATPKFIKEKPEALKAFLRAFTKGAKDVLAKPDDAIAFVKERDGIINVDLEKAPPAHGHRRRRRQPRRARRGLRPAEPGAPVADGQPGVGRLRHEDAGGRRRRVERQLPAERRRTEHPAAGRRSERRHDDVPAFVDFRDVWLAYNDELLASRRSSPSRPST